jgi:RNA polymerase sigma factor (sigma-70 family)
MATGLELLAERAVEGDHRALEELVSRIRGDVHRLASRMLRHAPDAEDASQEILIKVVTHLASFRGESAFRTWVWRVACNHLLATRRTRAERAGIFAILVGQSGTDGALVTAQPSLSPEQALAMERVKACCTRGFLSVDRDHRVALLLSEIFELGSEEAAEVLAIKPAAFRKRLSRAKERMRAFMAGHCAMVGRARCRGCARAALDLDGDPVATQLHELEELSDAALSLRDEEGRGPATEEIRRLIASGRYRALAG